MAWLLDFLCGNLGALAPCPPCISVIKTDIPQRLLELASQISGDDDMDWSDTCLLVETLSH